MDDIADQYRVMLKSKIHRAVVTDAELHYEGSITIDSRLMELADLVSYEQVQIWDIDSGARLSTYVIEGPRNSGEICMNGAAARLVHKGDRVIVASFTMMPFSAAVHVRPKIVFVDENNRPELVENYLTSDDLC